MFARRALQRRLNELRETLGNNAVDKLAARLNKPSSDRMAAMWEVVVLHGLMRCGTLQHETPLSSGHRPDVTFENDKVRFIADITAVSDEGLDNNNPYFELSRLVEKEKTKLGLAIGGVDLRVKSREQPCGRGSRTVLRLPPRAQLQSFVTKRIIPQLKKQMNSNEKVLRVKIDDENAGIDLIINPTGSPYSGGSFASYDIPKTKDRNPIFNALKGKVSQLRGATGITGVIVGDGDCMALSDRPLDRNEVSAAAIAEDFLRQHSSMDFVLFLKVREKRHLMPCTGAEKRWIDQQLIVRNDCQAKKALGTLFAAMLAELPETEAMPANGALRTRETGYDLGYHGGYKMGGNKIRISSRELIETLSGLRTLGDNGAKFVTASRKLPQQVNAPQKAFLRNLQQGRLPVSISVIKTGEDDNDDWVEFEFGDPDPAISPLH
ncbi:MAG: hypothetical protein PHW76_08390 [Alphaproteobacteria bacterium]|nr:hypothetical protein [Alphaproteobacteria bacterium]